MTGKEKAKLIDYCMGKNRIKSDDILKFPNVPAIVAARYLGTTIGFVYTGLQNGTLPIGVAKFKEKWSYHISPAKLIAYEEGIYIEVPEAG